MIKVADYGYSIGDKIRLRDLTDIRDRLSEIEIFNVEDQDCLIESNQLVVGRFSKEFGGSVEVTDSRGYTWWISSELVEDIDGSSRDRVKLSSREIKVAEGTRLRDLWDRGLLAPGVEYKIMYSGGDRVFHNRVESADDVRLNLTQISPKLWTDQSKVTSGFTSFPYTLVDRTPRNPGEIQILSQSPTVKLAQTLIDDSVSQIAGQYLPLCTIIYGESLVSGKVWTGSGLLVGRDKILTCAHVATGEGQERPRLRCSFTGRSTMKCKTLAINEDLDVALLQSEHAPALDTVAELGDDIGVGERIVVVSSPKGMYNLVTAGVISAPPRELQGVDHPVMFVDVSIEPGSSGGAVIETSTGKVVGIVRGSISSLHYCVPMSVIKPWVDDTLSSLRRGAE